MSESNHLKTDKDDLILAFRSNTASITGENLKSVIQKKRFFQKNNNFIGRGVGRKKCKLRIEFF